MPDSRWTLATAGGLVLALVAGFAIGKAVQPTAQAGPEAIPSHTHPASTADLGGTTLSSGGYTLVPGATTFPAGIAQPFTFRIIGPDRKPVTDFAVAQERRLHLVVARHDLTGFQHRHPAMAADGTWSIPLTLPGPGLFHAYADFVAGGTAITLGVDLTVPGDFSPAALPPPSRQTTSDGFSIAYEGSPQAGATQPITVRVGRGSAAATLQPYLGALGHLVVLREGDLAYLHVHPDPQLVHGGVRFWLATPSTGRYRAFFEFQVADAESPEARRAAHPLRSGSAGAVHTAAFTMDVS
jgi:hypothetical protein